jgi:pimeloyl-ACP methyl ester carboxylesterase
MVNVKEYTIPSEEENYPIRISYYKAAPKMDKPFLIFCHGFKGFKDWGPFPLMAERFASDGFPTILFNFSLNGLSDKSPKEIEDLEAFSKNSIRRELQDLLRVINHVVSTYQPKSLGLIGHSRGGGIALLGAAHHSSVKKVACLAPVHDFGKRYSQAVLSQWKKEGVLHVINGRNNMKLPMLWSSAEDYRKHKSLLDLPLHVPQLTIPILVFHGYQDATLPVEEARILATWNPHIKLNLMETGHTFGGKHPWDQQDLPPALSQATDEMKAFFQEKSQ